tara:strand:+ start:9447 stop:10058 length:612 start_codon:yes stop_codon:yes gene_type:complete
MGIAENRRQFDKVQKLLSPYVTAGGSGLSAMMDLGGFNGNAAQRGQINGITGGAEYGALVGAGENAILANASATGGLRGGNTQSALVDNRQSILSGLINRQYDRFSGIATMGQNSATGVGAAATQMGNQNAGLLAQSGAAQAAGFTQAGAAQAGSALAQGAATQNALGGIAQTGGWIASQYATPAGTAGGLPAGATPFGSWGF